MAVWAKVVNNAASVTRLNLSLRLHATIFNASRRQRCLSWRRAALARASESESECAMEREGRRQASGTRPTFAARLLRHLGPTTERSSCEENR